MWDLLRRVFAVKDVRNKLLFTLAILAVVRILDHITIPLSVGGRQRLLEIFNTPNSQGLGQVFGLLDVLSGGSLHTFSIVSLSVYPYITATIVISLLQPLIPALKNLTTQGESGRLRISQITRIVTVPLAFLQALSACAIYQQQQVLTNFSLLDPTLNSLAIVLTLTAGVMILVWLGELITEKGIGNGISLIIFGGITSSLPQTIQRGYLAASSSNGSALISIVVLVAVVAFMMLGMVYLYLGQRRVPIQYPTKRVVAQSYLSGSARTTYIPMQVNSAGMIPLIFASSILLFPTALVRYLSAANTGWIRDSAVWSQTWLFNADLWWYWLLNAVFVFAFTYFYAHVLWQQQDLPDSLQKQGAFVQGHRPGISTGKYLLSILNRITFGGAFFLAVATILPELLRLGNTQVLSSTSLLIVIGVVLDTLRQLEAELEVRNYSGFLAP